MPAVEIIPAGMSTLRSGVAKFGWFSRLKNSALNWNEVFSAIASNNARNT